MKEYKVNQTIKPNTMYAFDIKTKVLKEVETKNFAFDFNTILYEAVKKLSETKGALFVTIPSNKGNLVIMFEEIFNKKYNK